MYCSRTDLVERFGAEVIADLEYDRPDAVVQAIADTTAVIDGYLASRYPLPLASVPAVVKSIARDLVRYELDIDPDDTVKRRRDEAMKHLTSIQRGEMTLGLPVADEPDSLDTAEIQNDGHVFRRSSTEFI
jgi:phage gp36-like protein